MTKIAETWLTSFNEFIKYKNKFKTLHIPSNSLEYRHLRLWTYTQRVSYIKGTLHPEQIKMLQSIKFAFLPFEERWQKWFDELIEYKNKFGHPNVYYRQKGYIELSIWLYNQKRARAKLKKKRKEKLVNIGVRL